VTVLIARLVHRLNLAFLVLDAIGLVVFTMAGCDVAWQMNEPLAIVIVTGCAGGVLRDILCNDVPLLFRSELYASVSVVTGLFYATAFGLNLNNELWTALTFVLGLSLRRWRSATNGKCRNSCLTARRNERPSQNTLSLILRSAHRASRRVAMDDDGASWFETTLSRLLTMRGRAYFRALATSAGVTADAALPQALRT